MTNKELLNGRPNPENAPAYAQSFFQLTAEENNLYEAFTKNMLEFEQFIHTLPKEKEDFRYADDKWTVKGVIAHCIETERILQYRALRFSRKDKTALAGFDENWYVDHNQHDTTSLSELCNEFISVRKASLSLFQGMTTSMLDFVGVANENPNTARNIGWFIIGHTKHHVQVIKQRYLVDQDEMY